MLALLIYKTLLGPLLSVRRVRMLALLIYKTLLGPLLSDSKEGQNAGIVNL
jgi:hypothetical protein